MSYQPKILQLISIDENPEDLLSKQSNWQNPTRIHLGDKRLWIIPHVDNRAKATLKLLDVFLKKIAEKCEPHQAMGIAIRESLGWQWTAVCRIQNDDEFEIQTWMEGDELFESEMQALEGTACEIVLQHGRFIFFKDIAEAFDDEEYAEMGAKIYAGIAYHVDDEPYGHIFALHDDSHVDVGVADAVLTLATELLGRHLSMLSAHKKVDQWQSAASTDSLTGVLNRWALDEYVEQISADKPLSVVVIDLDGLKLVNDQFGHTEGDKLLTDFAQGLKSISRKDDCIFRYGGDEFVLLIPHESGNMATELSGRLNVLIKNMESGPANAAGASVGVSNLSETQGDFDMALKLADERMYINKRLRRKLSS